MVIPNDLKDKLQTHLNKSKWKDLIPATQRSKDLFWLLMEFMYSHGCCGSCDFRDEYLQDQVDDIADWTLTMIDEDKNDEEDSYVDYLLKTYKKYGPHLIEKWQPVTELLYDDMLKRYRK